MSCRIRFAHFLQKVLLKVDEVKKLFCKLINIAYHWMKVSFNVKIHLRFIFKIYSYTIPYFIGMFKIGNDLSYLHEKSHYGKWWHVLKWVLLSFWLLNAANSMCAYWHNFDKISYYILYISKIIRQIQSLFHLYPHSYEHDNNDVCFRSNVSSYFLLLLVHTPKK